MIGGVLVLETGAVENRADAVNRQVLRVCSDPANLPFSNQKEEGYENKLAKIVAEELKVPLEYTWFPQATGFIRQTLFSKRCDLVMGWGQGDELVLNTNHYLRTSYALVYKKGGAFDGVDSIMDPKLKGKKVGLVAGTPVSEYVLKAGLMGTARAYRLTVDRRVDAPGGDMVKDIRSGEIDVGLMWGPMAAYWAKQGGDPLTIVPLIKDKDGPKLAYRITMGVRPSDDNWKRELNAILKKRQSDFDAVLLDYGIPMLDEDDTPITAPRK